MLRLRWAQGDTGLVKPSALLLSCHTWVEPGSPATDRLFLLPLPWYRGAVFNPNKVHFPTALWVGWGGKGCGLEPQACVPHITGAGGGGTGRA